MYDVTDHPGKRTLSIQVTDDTHGLWFSNNWTGSSTAISATAPRIQGGTFRFRE